MARLDVSEVEIVLKDGRVLHFLTSEGDTIVCLEVNTYAGDKPTEDNKVHYFALQLSPSESTKG